MQWERTRWLLSEKAKLNQSCANTLSRTRTASNLIPTLISLNVLYDVESDCLKGMFYLATTSKNVSNMYGSMYPKASIQNYSGYFSCFEEKELMPFKGVLMMHLMIQFLWGNVLLQLFFLHGFLIIKTTLLHGLWTVSPYVLVLKNMQRRRLVEDHTYATIHIAFSFTQIEQKRSNKEDHF